VIGDELTRNGNAVGATQKWCTHHRLGDGGYFGESGVAGTVTSAQGSPETALDGAIPGVSMLMQPSFRP
jgi:hypothetical protein